MRMYDVITHKKRGEKLTNEEIAYVVKGYTNGTIPDYQMSAWLMACCLKGLDEQETTTLTLEMAHSGDLLDLSAIHGIKADKHSTGGVGDKTSLIIGPMVAACGVPVAKMSGRGLGHTGGTIDKLESIPGFSTKLTPEQFIHNVNTCGLAIVGQTANLAPADKKIYALRDVTATVDNLSLIAASIMSKKLAAGAQVIVLDVKVGSGAFMKNTEDAIALAKQMVAIGNGAGRKTYAVLSNMYEPLGEYVGNALEVKEAIAAVNGTACEDLMLVSKTLAAFMLIGCQRAANLKEAMAKLETVIANGAAAGKLEQFVEMQGGDGTYITHPEQFPCAEKCIPVTAEADGFVQEINTEEIGMCSLLLGGGRATKESSIDPTVGLHIDKKLGDAVHAGDTLGILYANENDACTAESIAQAVSRFRDAYKIGKKDVKRPEILYGYVDETGYHAFSKQ